MTAEKNANKTAMHCCLTQAALLSDHSFLVLVLTIMFFRTGAG